MPLSVFSAQQMRSLDDRIRQQQRSFHLENGRLPTKRDIDRANLASLYRSYQHLKKLEQKTFSENVFSNDCDENKRRKRRRRSSFMGLFGLSHNNETVSKLMLSPKCSNNTKNDSEKEKTLTSNSVDSVSVERRVLADLSNSDRFDGVDKQKQNLPTTVFSNNTSSLNTLKSQSDSSSSLNEIGRIDFSHFCNETQSLLTKPVVVDSSNDQPILASTTLPTPDLHKSSPSKHTSELNFCSFLNSIDKTPLTPKKQPKDVLVLSTPSKKKQTKRRSISGASTNSTNRDKTLHQMMQTSFSQPEPSATILRILSTPPKQFLKRSRSFGGTFENSLNNSGIITNNVSNSKPIPNFGSTYENENENHFNTHSNSEKTFEVPPNPSIPIIINQKRIINTPLSPSKNQNSTSKTTKTKKKSFSTSCPKQMFNLKRTKWKHKRLNSTNLKTFGKYKFFEKLRQKKGVEEEKKNDSLYCDLFDFDGKNKNEFIGVSKSQKNEERREINLEEMKKLDLKKLLREEFGFSDFRPGQEQAIRHIIENRSCLLILPTGAGKSLCYQMAAHILCHVNNHDSNLPLNPKPIALIITPLLSLMQDQLQRLPQKLKGAIQSSCQNRTEILNLVQDLSNSAIDIIFCSPERLLEHNFQQVWRRLSPRLYCAFACIDEAHCVSEQSHNFRPAYIDLDRILREKLGVKNVLALTATATIQTRLSICKLLSIPQSNIVDESTCNSRSNLALSVSMETNRVQALLVLLKSRRFQPLRSTIVYVARKRQADTLATTLRINLSGCANTVASYHSSKSAQERSRIQAQFMEGKIVVLVATLAFGMGLNKRNVRSIVHYSPPKTFEDYVQQIGRAGRDNLKSECHCFYNEDDVVRLRSLVFSDYVGLSQVRWVLRVLFGVLGSKSRRRRSSIVSDGDGDAKSAIGNYISLNLEDIARQIDVSKPEIISTILSHLQGDYHNQSSTPYLRLFPNVHSQCSIGLLVDSQELRNKSPLIDYILNTKTRLNNGTYKIDLCHLANYFKIDLFDVHRDLAALKADHKITVEQGKTLTCAKILINLTLDSIEELAQKVQENLVERIKNQLTKVNIVGQAFSLVALDKFSHFKSPKDKTQGILPKLIQNYFDCEHCDDFLSMIDQRCLPEERLASISPVGTTQIEKEIRLSLKLLYQTSQTSSDFKKFLKKIDLDDDGERLALAFVRILHGMQSPSFTQKDQNRNELQGKHVSYPFLDLLSLTKEQLKLNEKKKTSTQKAN